jgi:hypothetical protein
MSAFFYFSASICNKNCGIFDKRVVQEAAMKRMLLALHEQGIHGKRMLMVLKEGVGLCVDWCVKWLLLRNKC